VALLGETWAGARAALPGMVVFTCAIGATVGAAAVFRAVDQTRYIFYCSAVLGPLMLGLSVAASCSPTARALPGASPSQRSS
jgi:hypothetical protein